MIETPSRVPPLSLVISRIPRNSLKIEKIECPILGGKVRSGREAQFLPS